ncbi:conserved Plasmodium protein, unknown function [Plasmodium gallinaceum]|uniref:PNPLA domain-containing protein n=1 Tax=Plasmodium gallinaceum TaxID=5849 RepID=A0A1J1GPN9_PLAGA|nr:conserved Plasmodium protein, unknown function [Plasmodium gallinaceum]CRG94389.1 conserved Plasmodium protein, unknown function [Plasmodium gallinaceum]
MGNSNKKEINKNQGDTILNLDDIGEKEKKKIDNKIYVDNKKVKDEIKDNKINIDIKECKDKLNSNESLKSKTTVDENSVNTYFYENYLRSFFNINDINKYVINEKSESCNNSKNLSENHIKMKNKNVNDIIIHNNKYIINFLNGKEKNKIEIANFISFYFFFLNIKNLMNDSSKNVLLKDVSDTNYIYKKINKSKNYISANDMETCIRNYLYHIDKRNYPILKKNIEIGRNKKEVKEQSMMNKRKSNYKNDDSQIREKKKERERGRGRGRERKRKKEKERKNRRQRKIINIDDENLKKKIIKYKTWEEYIKRIKKKNIKRKSFVYKKFIPYKLKNRNIKILKQKNKLKKNYPLSDNICYTKVENDEKMNNEENNNSNRNENKEKINKKNVNNISTENNTTYVEENENNLNNEKLKNIINRSNYKSPNKQINQKIDNPYSIYIKNTLSKVFYKDEIKKKAKMRQAKGNIINNKEKIEQMNVGISFSPAGLLIPYHLGVSSLLIEKNILNIHTNIAGSSAGSICACCLSIGLNVDKCFFLIENIISNVYKNGCYQKLQNLLNIELNKYLYKDSYKFLNKRTGNVFVGITQILPFYKKLNINKFYDDNDLISAIIASCNIPMYLSSNIFVNFRNKKCIDGFFSTKKKDFGCPNTKTDRTIKVSPFDSDYVGIENKNNSVISPHLIKYNHVIVLFLSIKNLFHKFINNLFLKKDYLFLIYNLKKILNKKIFDNYEFLKSYFSFLRSNEIIDENKFSDKKNSVELINLLRIKLNKLNYMDMNDLEIELFIDLNNEIFTQFNKYNCNLIKFYYFSVTLINIISKYFSENFCTSSLDKIVSDFLENNKNYIDEKYNDYVKDKLTDIYDFKFQEVIQFLKNENLLKMNKYIHFYPKLKSDIILIFFKEIFINENIVKIDKKFLKKKITFMIEVLKEIYFNEYIKREIIKIIFFIDGKELDNKSTDNYRKHFLLTKKKQDVKPIRHYLKYNHIYKNFIYIINEIKNYNNKITKINKHNYYNFMNLNVEDINDSYIFLYVYLYSNLYYKSLLALMNVENIEKFLKLKTSKSNANIFLSSSSTGKNEKNDLKKDSSKNLNKTSIITLSKKFSEMWQNKKNMLKQNINEINKNQINLFKRINIEKNKYKVNYFKKSFSETNNYSHNNEIYYKELYNKEIYNNEMNNNKIYNNVIISNDINSFSFFRNLKCVNKMNYFKYRFHKNGENLLDSINNNNNLNYIKYFYSFENLLIFNYDYSLIKKICGFYVMNKNKIYEMNKKKKKDIFLLLYHIYIYYTDILFLLKFVFMINFNEKTKYKFFKKREKQNNKNNKKVKKDIGISRIERKNLFNQNSITYISDSNMCKNIDSFFDSKCEPSNGGETDNKIVKINKNPENLNNIYIDYIDKKKKNENNKETKYEKHVNEKNEKEKIKKGRYNLLLKTECLKQKNIRYTESNDNDFIEELKTDINENLYNNYQTYFIKNVFSMRKLFKIALEGADENVIKKIYDLGRSNAYLWLYVEYLNVGIFLYKKIYMIYLKLISAFESLLNLTNLNKKKKKNEFINLSASNENVLIYVNENAYSLLDFCNFLVLCYSYYNYPKNDAAFTINNRKDKHNNFNFISSIFKIDKKNYKDSFSDNVFKNHSDKSINSYGNHKDYKNKGDYFDKDNEIACINTTNSYRSKNKLNTNEKFKLNGNNNKLKINEKLNKENLDTVSTKNKRLKIRRSISLPLNLKKTVMKINNLKNKININKNIIDGINNEILKGTPYEHIYTHSNFWIYSSSDESEINDFNNDYYFNNTDNTIKEFDNIFEKIPSELDHFSKISNFFKNFKNIDNNLNLSGYFGF